MITVKNPTEIESACITIEKESISYIFFQNQLLDALHEIQRFYRDRFQSGATFVPPILTWGFQFSIINCTIAARFDFATELGKLLAQADMLCMLTELTINSMPTAAFDISKFLSPFKQAGDDKAGTASVAASTFNPVLDKLDFSGIPLTIENLNDLLTCCESILSTRQLILENCGLALDHSNCPLSRPPSPQMGMGASSSSSCRLFSFLTALSDKTLSRESKQKAEFRLSLKGNRIDENLFASYQAFSQEKVRANFQGRRYVTVKCDCTAVAMGAAEGKVEAAKVKVLPSARKMLYYRWHATEQVPNYRHVLNISIPAGLESSLPVDRIRSIIYNYLSSTGLRRVMSFATHPANELTWNISNPPKPFEILLAAYLGRPTRLSELEGGAAIEGREAELSFLAIDLDDLLGMELPLGVDSPFEIPVANIQDAAEALYAHNIIGMPGYHFGFYSLTCWHFDVLKKCVIAILRLVFAKKYPGSEDRHQEIYSRVIICNQPCPLAKEIKISQGGLQITPIPQQDIEKTNLTVALVKELFGRMMARYREDQIPTIANFTVWTEKRALLAEAFNPFLAMPNNIVCEYSVSPIYSQPLPIITNLPQECTNFHSLRLAVPLFWQRVDADIIGHPDFKAIYATLYPGVEINAEKEKALQAVAIKIKQELRLAWRQILRSISARFDHFKPELLSNHLCTEPLTDEQVFSLFLLEFCEENIHLGFNQEWLLIEKIYVLQQLFANHQINGKLSPYGILDNLCLVIYDVKENRIKPYKRLMIEKEGKKYYQIAFKNDIKFMFDNEIQWLFWLSVSKPISDFAKVWSSIYENLIEKEINLLNANRAAIENMASLILPRFADLRALALRRMEGIPTKNPAEPLQLSHYIYEKELTPEKIFPLLFIEACYEQMAVLGLLEEVLLMEKLYVLTQLFSGDYILPTVLDVETRQFKPYLLRKHVSDDSTTYSLAFKK